MNFKCFGSLPVYFSNCNWRSSLTRSDIYIQKTCAYNIFFLIYIYNIMLSHQVFEWIANTLVHMYFFYSFNLNLKWSFWCNDVTKQQIYVVMSVFTSRSAFLCILCVPSRYWHIFTEYLAKTKVFWGNVIFLLAIDRFEPWCLLFI